MSSLQTSDTAIAVLSPFVNFRELRALLVRLGLQAKHVIRPSYRESLRWLQDRMVDLRYRAGLPVLFVYEDGEVALVRDEAGAAQALARMVAPEYR